MSIIIINIGIITIYIYLIFNVKTYSTHVYMKTDGFFVINFDIIQTYLLRVMATNVKTDDATVQ